MQPFSGEPAGPPDEAFARIRDAMAQALCLATGRIVGPLSRMSLEAMEWVATVQDVAISAAGAHAMTRTSLEIHRKQVNSSL